MLFFELGDLFAERKLRYMQSVRSTREVQLFGQNHDCVQVTYFNVREHCSKPHSLFNDTKRFVFGAESETPPRGHVVQLGHEGRSPAA